MSRRDSATLVVGAAPDAVHRAFATAEALMTWLPPGGMSGRALEYDFRPGGRYRIELTYADDGANAGKTDAHSDVTHGQFLAIEPGRRIVQDVEFVSDDAAFSGRMVMTWTFEPVTGGTRVTVTADDVPSGISPEDHAAGLSASLENLAAHVTR